MRTYLTIISFVLFICAVSSRSISLFSNEDYRSQLPPVPINRRFPHQPKLLYRLRNLLDNSDDDEITYNQPSSSENESIEEDEDDDENTDKQQPSLRSKSSEQDDADDKNVNSQPSSSENELVEEDEVDDENTDKQQPSLRSKSSEQDDADDQNFNSQPSSSESEQDYNINNAVKIVRKKRELSKNDDDTSNVEDEPVVDEFDDETGKDQNNNDETEEDQENNDETEEDQENNDEIEEDQDNSDSDSQSIDSLY